MSNDKGQNSTIDFLKAGVSLTEELQSIAAKLSGAESETDVERGLERLKRLREQFTERGAIFDSDPAASAARHKAEELIGHTEASLEKLRRYIVHKRRLQEGEAMNEIAARREAETGILGALGSSSSAGFETFKASAPTENAENDNKDKEAASPLGAGHAPVKPKSPRPESTKNVQTAQKRPSPAAQKRPELEWSRTYRLAAHMAGSFIEDRQFFEKLRKGAVKPGNVLAAPRDHATAEAHFKAVHGLNVRLVNIELKAKAITEAYKNNSPVSGLFRTASNEISGFMRDLKARKEELPAMSDEYERLFGGYAEKFASTELTKGGGILDRCLAEQKKDDGPSMQPKGPQRVLSRNDN